MTLRTVLGADANRVHQLVDELLDNEDSVVVLIDGRRAMSYTKGFGLSACQLELLAIEIERVVRTIAGRTAIRGTERRSEMRRATVVAVALAFVSLWVVAAAGVTAVWLTQEVRVLGLVIVPTAIVASLLILYFDWRATRRRRILAERDEHDKAA